MIILKNSISYDISFEKRLRTYQRFDSFLVELSISYNSSFKLSGSSALFEVGLQQFQISFTPQSYHAFPLLLDFFFDKNQSENTFHSRISNHEITQCNVTSVSRTANIPQKILTNIREVLFHNIFRKSKRVQRNSEYRKTHSLGFY